MLFNYVDQPIKGVVDVGSIPTTQKSGRAAPLAGVNVAVLGDSIIAQGFGGSATTGFTKNTRGFATWLPFVAHRRFEIPPTMNFGVSGETSAQILARVQSAIDAAPAACIVLAGTNDISVYTAQQTATYLREIYDRLQAAGIIVVAIPILPRSGTSSTENGRILQVNEWIKGQRAVRDRFYVVDCSLAFGDPATGGPRTDYSYDGTIHPDARGALAIANEINTLLSALFPTPVVCFANTADTYDATLNRTGNIIASVGSMAGTSGSLTSGPTGSLATGWSCSGTNLPSGTTMAFAKVSKADGRVFQEVTFGGTYNSASPSSVDVSISSSVHSSISAGDQVYAEIEIEADSGIENIASYGLLANFISSSGNMFPADLSGNSSFIPPNIAFSGVARTHPVTIISAPSSVTIAMRFQMKAVGGSSNSTGVFRFGAAAIRKVSTLV